MSDNDTIDKHGSDPLIYKIRAEKREDPAPALSGTAKAAIIEAATGQAPSAQAGSLLREPLEALMVRFTGGLEVLLRPVAIGTLGFAGIAGLAAGGITAAPAYAELSPEEELASYYEFAVSGGGEFYDSQDTDGVE